MMANNTTDFVLACQDVDSFSDLYLTITAVFLIIILLGITGNVLTFLVLHLKSVNSVNNFLLKIQALWDALFLLSAFIALCIEVFVTIKGDSPQQTKIKKEFQADTVVTATAFTLQLGSNWHLVLTGLYHFLTVFKPFWTEKNCTIRNVVKVVAALFVACIILHIPWYILISEKRSLHFISFAYELPHYDDNHLGRFMLFLYLCMFLFIPMGLTAIFNIEIQKARQKAKPIFTKMALTNGTDLQQKRVRRTFLSISLLFIVTSGPLLLTFIIIWISKSEFDGISNMRQRSKQCLAMVGYILLLTGLPLLNASVKIIFYLQLKSFRKGIGKLVHCLKTQTKHVRFAEHDNKSYSYEQ